MALTYKGKEIIGKPTSGYYVPVKTYENKIVTKKKTTGNSGFFCAKIFVS